MVYNGGVDCRMILYFSLIRRGWSSFFYICAVVLALLILYGLTIMGQSGRSFLQRLLKYLWDFFRDVLSKVLSIGPIPQHIAFIMDGNRRFGRNQNLKAGAGHQAGFLALMSILQYCYELGVKYVTIYAFSIDNFKRSPDEVDRLMELMLEKMEDLLNEKSILDGYEIKINFIGNLDLLSAPVKLAAEKIMVSTAGNKRVVLSVCVAYTCTHEIVHSVQEYCKERLKKVQQKNLNNELSSTSLEDPGSDFIKILNLESHMYTAGIPDPDMLIRTSGEYRLSNFLLWQTSFCNLIATDVLWPEFSFRHLVWAILKHQQVHRYLARRKR